MRNTLACLFVFFIWISSVSSATQSIGFQSQFHFAEKEVTLKDFWSLAPDLPNPHRARWLLTRDLNAVGMATFVQKNQKYGAKIEAVRSRQVGALRGLGPWYQTLEDMPCDKRLRSIFGTKEGAQVALVAANQLWEALAKERLIQLGYSLGKIATDSPSLALKRAEQSFEVWKKETASEWLELVEKSVSRAEWNYYEKLTHGKCSKKEPFKKNRMVMESVSSGEFGEPIQMNSKPVLKPDSTVDSKIDSKLLSSELVARAPARLWNGLFTVHLDLAYGRKKLTGRFLVDPTASRHLISPLWLKSQGVYPKWVELPNLPLASFRWDHLFSSPTSFGGQAWFEEVSLSGERLSFHEFVLQPTELFGIPDHVGSCCAGILGIDLLKEYAVEFQPAYFPEVRLFKKETYLGPEKAHWIELSQSQNILKSQCGFSSAGASHTLAEVQWDLGQEKAYPSGRKSEKSSLYCDGSVLLFDQMNLPSDVKSPVRLGLPILSRGIFAMDLPHGKLWLAQEGLEKQLPKENNSGLKVSFRYLNGSRLLFVASLKETQATRGVIRGGLKAGMILTRVNGKEADELDLWQINRALAGDSGNQVALEWKKSKASHETYRGYVNTLSMRG